MYHAFRAVRGAKLLFSLPRYAERRSVLTPRSLAIIGRQKYHAFQTVACAESPRFRLCCSERRSFHTAYALAPLDGNIDHAFLTVGSAVLFVSRPRYAEQCCRGAARVVACLTPYLLQKGYHAAQLVQTTKLPLFRPGPPEGRQRLTAGVCTDPVRID